MRRTAFVVDLAILGLVCGCSASDLPVAPAEAAQATTPFARVDLGTLGGQSSVASDVNKYDIVIGTSQTPSGASHAFRWSASEGMTDLGTLPGDRESEAIAILDGSSPGEAEILGVSGEEGHWTPVVWSASGSRSLPIPLLAHSSIGRPTGFNNRGQVIGWDLLANQHAWIWSQSDGKYDLTANIPGGTGEGAASTILTSGVVLLTTQAAGCHLVTECWRTYLWNPQTGYFALGTPNNESDAAVTGLGANESGSIVGWMISIRRGTSAYRWDGVKGFTILSHYSDRGQGYATAINASGTAVGAETDPISGAFVATLWPSQGGIVRLSPSNPNASVAVAINGAGTVAGWAAVAENTNHAVIWTSQYSSIQQMAATAQSQTLVASSGCLAQIGAVISRQRLIGCGLANGARR